MALKICVCCSKEYHVPKYREQITKYCSKDCLNKGQYLSIIKICPTCLKEFRVSNSRQKQIYCSELCKHTTKINIKDRRKASKISSILSRGTVSSRQLRKYIFNTRIPKCEVCSYSEYLFNIDIHHIDGNALNNTDSNLAMLCVMCHRKLHKGVINNAAIKR